MLWRKKKDDYDVPAVRAFGELDYICKEQGILQNEVIEILSCRGADAGDLASGISTELPAVFREPCRPEGILP